jgi:hypothetical protein
MLITLGFGHIEKLGRLANALDGTVDLANVGAQARTFAPELLGPRGVRPDGGVLELARDFLEALVLAVVLKETP